MTTSSGVPLRLGSSAGLQFDVPFSTIHLYRFASDTEQQPYPTLMRIKITRALKNNTGLLHTAAKKTMWFLFTSTSFLLSERGTRLAPLERTGLESE
jgi:hypothetical protein